MHFSSKCGKNQENEETLRYGEDMHTLCAHTVVVYCIFEGEVLSFSKGSCSLRKVPVLEKHLIKGFLHCL